MCLKVLSLAFRTMLGCHNTATNSSDPTKLIRRKIQEEDTGMPDVQIEFTKVGQKVNIDLDRPRPQVDSQGLPERNRDRDTVGPQPQHS